MLVSLISDSYQYESSRQNYASVFLRHHIMYAIALVLGCTPCTYDFRCAQVCWNRVGYLDLKTRYDTQSSLYPVLMYWLEYIH